MSLFLVCAIIVLNLPYAIAEETSEQDLSMIYETDTVDLASYSFQDINDDPELRNQYINSLGAAYEVEIVSSSNTAQTDEIWNNLTNLNLEIKELQKDQAVLTDLKNQLAAYQEESVVNVEEKTESAMAQVSSDPMPSTNAEVESTSADINSEPVTEDTTDSTLSDLDVDQAIEPEDFLTQEDVEIILSEIEKYEAQEIDSQLASLEQEYARLENRLNELGGGLTEDEYYNILMNEPNLQESIAQNESSVDAESEMVAAQTGNSNIPDFHTFVDMYTIYKSYCTVSVPGTGYSYNTYTVSVQNKPTTDKLYDYCSNIPMYVNAYNPNAAEEFLTSVFEAGLVAGAGAIGGAVGAYFSPIAGTVGSMVGKWTAQAIFELLDRDDDLIITWHSKDPVYQISVGQTVHMRYVYVIDSSGSYQLVLSANRANLEESHQFAYHYYDCITHEDTPFIENKVVSSRIEGIYSNAQQTAVKHYYDWCVVQGKAWSFDKCLNASVGDLEYVGRANGKESKKIVKVIYAHWPSELINPK